MKSKTTALVLSILLGELGIDRFYLGYTGMGVLKLLTAGCFGILYIIDIINIATGRLLPADGTSYYDAAAKSSDQLVDSSNNYLEKLNDLKDSGAINGEEYSRLEYCLLNNK